MNLDVFRNLQALGFAPKCIIDGGANVGAWAREVRGVFPSARIITIEGNEECRPHLHEFDPEISLIGDYDGNAPFFVSTENKYATGNSTLRENTRFYRTDNSIEKQVRMRRLDSLLAEREIDRVDLLKLDLQGAELMALNGLGAYLQKTEFIVFEASLVEYNRGQPLFADLHRFLDDHGFACFDVTEQHRVAGVSFQLDFVYVRKGSPFRPLFTSAFDGARLAASSLQSAELGARRERQSLIDHINARRQRGPCRVIGFGTAAESWAQPVCDVHVDSRWISGAMPDQTMYRFELDDREGWQSLAAFVRTHGKFDFSIVTNELEFVRDPEFVCRMISEVAKEGFIALPSKHKELSRYEFGANCYRGAATHRWLFSVQQGQLICLAKLPLIEYLGQLDVIATTDVAKEELRLFWFNEVPLQLEPKGKLRNEPAQLMKAYEKLTTEAM